MLVKNGGGPELEGLRASAQPHCIRMPEDDSTNPAAKPQQPSKQLGKALSKKPGVNSHKLTEYFPVRRSVRKCKRAVLEERMRDLQNKVLQGLEEGLEKRSFVGKGWGVVATKNFAKGEFVVEYSGKLMDIGTAKKMEAKYAKDQNAGCYMYYFQHRNQQYCVDATAKSERLGRLVNHSRNGNLVTRIVEVGSLPRLVLIAKEDIPAGAEVCYDYGDRSRESIRHHPWLAM